MTAVRTRQLNNICETLYESGERVYWELHEDERAPQNALRERGWLLAIAQTEERTRQIRASIDAMIEEEAARLNRRRTRRNLLRRAWLRITATLGSVGIPSDGGRS